MTMPARFSWMTPEEYSEFQQVYQDIGGTDQEILIDFDDTGYMPDVGDPSIVGSPQDQRYRRDDAIRQREMRNAEIAALEDREAANRQARREEAEHYRQAQRISRLGATPGAVPQFNPDIPEVDDSDEDATLVMELQDWESMEPIGGSVADSMFDIIGMGGGLMAMGVAIPVGGRVAGYLAGRFGRITRLTGAQWNSLPGWVQTGLSALGVGVGIEFAMEAVGLEGAIPGVGLPSMNGHSGTYGVGSIVDGNQVVKTWHANGVPMLKLANGTMGAQRLDGTWRFWRPKKPIVVFGDGAGNMRDFIKADAALDRQAKRLRKALDRRAPRKTRKSAPAPHTHGGGGGGNVTNYEVGGK